MNRNFKDHFSFDSEGYKKYRPKYPKNLFSYLSSISPSNDLAWDCATGTGQTAKGLAEHFNKVAATDPSVSQLKNADRISNIFYVASTAEQSVLKNESVDIITVSQAMHWFDIPCFFKEAERVLKQEGILAVWIYNLLRISPMIDEVISDFYQNKLDRFWPEERDLVENNYESINFPFEKVHSPDFIMNAEWNLNELVGYIATWSAINKYNSVNSDSPVESINNNLMPLWGDPSTKRNIRWPLKLIVRKK
jgi:ubiquinone/menaquinone biosynthesis C-methylase UbiE